MNTTFSLKIVKFLEGEVTLTEKKTAYYNEIVRHINSCLGSKSLSETTKTVLKEKKGRYLKLATLNNNSECASSSSTGSFEEKYPDIIHKGDISIPLEDVILDENLKETIILEVSVLHWKCIKMVLGTFTFIILLLLNIIQYQSKYPVLKTF